MSPVLIPDDRGARYSRIQISAQKNHEYAQAQEIVMLSHLEHAKHRQKKRLRAGNIDVSVIDVPCPVKDVNRYLLSLLNPLAAHTRSCSSCLLL